MQRITKEWSGYHIIWPLADALKWRCSEFDRSIDEAFGELAQLCGDGRIKAVGIFTGSHPTRPMDWPKHDIWQGPPTSHPINTPMLGDIPATDWADLLYVLDENQRPTSSLKYASVRLPAWKGVEFDRDPLVELWRLIPPQYKEEAAQNNPKQEIAHLSGGRTAYELEMWHWLRGQVKQTSWSEVLAAPAQTLTKAFARHCRTEQPTLALPNRPAKMSGALERLRQALRKEWEGVKAKSKAAVAAKGQ